MGRPQCLEREEVDVGGGKMDRGRDGWMDGWTDRQTDGWTDRHTNRQVDGQTY